MIVPDGGSLTSSADCLTVLSGPPGKQLLLNLLVVLSQHGDHLSVAAVLLSCRAELLEYGLTLPTPPVTRHNLTGQSAARHPTQPDRSVNRPSHDTI